MMRVSKLLLVSRVVLVRSSSSLVRIVALGFNFIFFFKQKTSYELRISDWSSDVCSSDLPDKIMVRFAGQMLRRKSYSQNLAFDERVNGEHKDSFRVSLLLRPIEALENYTIYENTDIDENGNAQIFRDRKSVV